MSSKLDIHAREWYWNQSCYHVGHPCSDKFGETLKETVDGIVSHIQDFSYWRVFRIDVKKKIITHEFSVKDAQRLLKLYEL
jgi:hypothetical protein